MAVGIGKGRVDFFHDTEAGLRYQRDPSGKVGLRERGHL
ncbi:hypothetical protein J2851_005241 [Azospirillum rugosum]|uniref:Uncharacterized protein n=1 Tax=Azospirillum rugosum TaxID=416170 RepID=A0ABS4SS92_9PROT|nr:hypothetical protein [Azospirillum rugosum]MDQ0528310.1 hypothetical protein [Azospirillum rugosum]